MRALNKPARRGRTLLVSVAAAAGLLAPLGGAVAQAAVAPPGAVDITKNACPPSRVPNAGFTDTQSNTFKLEIDCIGDYGITRGKTDTTFQPGGVVLRQQMTEFLFNALVYSGAEPVNYASAGFTDLGQLSELQQKHVNALANAGVVKGTTATTFDGATGVTRAQMASFVARAQKLIDAGFAAGADYYDDDSNSVHQADINAITKAGLAQGVGGGRYDPHGMTTRAQMSGFMARFVESNIERGNIMSVYP